MTNTTAYTFNHANREIIITRTFDRASRNINSKEYVILSQLARDFAAYKIVVKSIKKKEGKKSYNGLTIDEMKRFIATRKNKKENDTFDKVLAITEGKKGKYAIVKKWFLEYYKSEYDKELEALALDAELKKIENEVVENTEEAYEAEEVEDAEEE